MSWVALDDFVDVMVRAVDDGSMRGLVPARLLAEGLEFSVPTFRDAVARALASG